MVRKHLPVIPAIVLRQHAVDEMNDPRFRSAARLLQSLWRDRMGLPIGTCVDHDGVIRPLGSRIANGEETGRNFLSPALARLAWEETIYREPGAMIDERRLWNNLLSSQPLTFNLFGPLRSDVALATGVLHELCPDLSDAAVREVLFEHSPGRGDPTLTGDYSAFDAALVYERADGRSGMVAIEVKYSEDCTEPQRALRAAAEVSLVMSNLYREPESSTLRRAPLQQFVREHLLIQMSVARGDYDEGRFVVVAPEPNRSVWAACARYRRQLGELSDRHVPFDTWPMEAIVDAMARSGTREHANAFFMRYLDWASVASEIGKAAPFQPTCTPELSTGR